jgi:putative addiction module component (TIGR02574 family)
MANNAAEHSREQGLESIQQEPMIMKTDDLILEIQSLPVEERTRIAECILRSLNPTVSEVDQRWADLAAKRLQEIQAGAVKPVAGDEVFGEIWR